MSSDKLASVSSVNLRVVNRVRKQLGLPKIVAKKVKCLGCEKEFISRNYPNIRLCKSCKDRYCWREGFNALDATQTLIGRNKIPIEINWSNVPLINENEA